MKLLNLLHPSSFLNSFENCSLRHQYIIGFTQLLKKFIICVKLSNVKKYEGVFPAKTKDKQARMRIVFYVS